MRDQARRGNWRGLGHWLRPGICLLILLATAVGQSGCTRVFFRQRADEEVESVLTQKNKFPDWASDIAPHPQRPGHAGVGRIEGTGYLALLAKWDEENRAAAVARGEKTAAPPDLYSSEAEANASKTLEPGTKHPRPYLITMEQAS